jgi:hypothetical protein
VLLGVFAVLPASRTVRGASLIGASVAAVGVVMFQHVYPYEWVSATPLLALATTTVYVFGVVTIFWCLFVALATFKTRNDPGGSARMEITREGTIQLVEEARSLGRFGGVGMFGTDLDGEVETQTNRETTTTDHDGASVESSGASTAVGDGGDATTATVGTEPQTTDDHSTAEPTCQSGFASGDSVGRSSAPDQIAPSADGGEVLADSGPVDGGAAFSNDFLSSASEGDDDDDELHQYCGNCRHFEYVMEDGESTPYCQRHERTMEDMEACSSWLER